MNFKNLMIVEDEDMTTLFIQESLKSNNYDNIWTYTSSDEAIKGIKDGKVPDFILMDINLRGSKDGLYTASQILKLHNIPILFMSSYDDKETIDEVLSISSYGFLSKPFNKRNVQIAVSFAYKLFTNQNPEEKFTFNHINLTKNCYYLVEDKTIIEDDKVVDISFKQKKFLDILIKNINNTVDKTQLSFELWSQRDVSDSSLRTIVYLLKKRFKGINIYSQSKAGYIFRDCRL